MGLWKGFVHASVGRQSFPIPCVQFSYQASLHRITTLIIRSGVLWCTVVYCGSRKIHVQTLTNKNGCLSTRGTIKFHLIASHLLPRRIHTCFNSVRRHYFNGDDT